MFKLFSDVFCIPPKLINYVWFDINKVGAQTNEGSGFFKARYLTHGNIFQFHVYLAANQIKHGTEKEYKGILVQYLQFYLERELGPPSESPLVTVPG